MKKNMLRLSLGVAFVLALALALTAPALAEDAAPAEPWQVRDIATPAEGVEPSFIALEGVRIAWTGAGANYSRMFVYNLSTSHGAQIPLPPNMSADSYFFNPSADGPWITYQGHREGGYDDIYLFDTASGSVTQITYNSAPGDWNDWNPRVQGNRIVWEKDMLGSNAKPGIYLYDIDPITPKTSLIIPGREYRDPDVWGDSVVCVKNPPPGSNLGTEIVLFNLVTHETKTIATNAKDNEHPRIDGGKVVWASGDVWAPGTDPSHTFQINLYDIATGATTQLTNNIAGNINPSIEGDLVAWQTAEPAGGAIWAYEVGTGADPVQVSLSGDTVGYPDVDNNSIAWFGSQGLYYAVHQSEATRFPDVPKDHPYATAIEGMADRKIIEGYENGDFGPDDLVTRQQFAKMIVLTMGFTVTENDTFTFADSASIVHNTGELYPYHYVAKAALTGLTEGYPDGTFRPLNNITRQQVITMIVRAGSQFLLPPPANYQGVLSYTDPTHGQNIRVAEFNGLLAGIVAQPGGSLAGWDTRANATRGEVAQMLWNLLGKLPPAA